MINGKIMINGKEEFINKDVEFVMNFINSVPQKRVDFTIILKEIMDKYPNAFKVFCDMYELNPALVGLDATNNDINVQKILYQTANNPLNPKGENKTIGHLIEEYFTKEISKFKINIFHIGHWRISLCIIRDLEGRYRCDFILPIFILLNDVICEPVYTKENDSKIQNNKITRNNSKQLCIKGKNNFLLSIFKQTLNIEIFVAEDTIVFQLIIDK